MTRDECFSTISIAYGGVKAWAIAGYWDIKVESEPPRTIVLSRKFVAESILGGGMTEDAFRRRLLTIPADQWIHEDGRLLLMIDKR